jgi:hypothetical protein
VPIGRVHIEDSPKAWKAEIGFAPLNLDVDSRVSLGTLRQVYCVIANSVDYASGSARVPTSIKRFSAWWSNGAAFVQDEQRTWGEIGVRNDDMLILLTESPTDETKKLVDLVIRKVAMIDADAERKSLTESIAEGLQAIVGRQARVKGKQVVGQVFIAMPMDESVRPDFADTHDTLRSVCQQIGLTAKRVDEVQTNDRITDTIRHLIESSEFVIADLTDNRPNVFFEAGYAEGIGITPIYIAKSGTNLHFDVKDYPVILFDNQRALRERVLGRLNALVKSIVH